MKANKIPYSGHLERGPDRIYKGLAIRIDLAGYGGAFELGYEGCTMAEGPDYYAAFIVRACNNHERLVEALRGLMDATGHIETPATNDGLNLCDAKAKARAALKELTQ